MTSQKTISVQTLAARGAVTFIIAVIVNLTLGWVALTQGLVASTEFFQYPPIVVWTLLGTAGATGVYGVLTRRSTTPDRMFVLLAIGALILSFLPNIGLLLAVEGVTTSEVIGLMALHVPPAIVAVLALPDTPLAQ
ncbi:DUF6069 family protein [Halorubrum alkaliphilum]|uniref:DUF6069 family protein n=1 Tax=Halorubrum alkaliphilum TaxID=261290 RepID=UPI001FD7F159|nr:DUF6069 family protein [Halorubrum alkaliphilum]